MSGSRSKGCKSESPSSGRRLSFVLAALAIALMVAAIACLAAVRPWEAESGGAPDSSGEETASVGDLRLSADGESIDYTPGEYGRVVVTGPSREDFSSEEAWEDYEANWHDKSWKGELPASGRYKYAHFEWEEGLSWVAGEVVVLFPFDTGDETIADYASGLDARVGAVSCSEAAHDFKMATFCLADDTDPFAASQDVLEYAPEALYAFPNISSTAAEETVNDPLVGEQDYLVLSRFGEAWDTVKCAQGATVAGLGG